MVEDLMRAFVALFVIIDPIGLTPIFVALTAHASPAFRRRMAYQGVAIAFVILLAFGVAGRQLIDLLGIGLPAFRMAGGAMLFLIALEMIFERRTQRRNEKAEEVQHAHEATQPTTEEDDISVFPIAMPFLAGPGAIATLMLLMGQQQGDLVMQAGILGAVLAVLLIALVLFRLSDFVARLMTPLMVTVISRLLGVLLAALSIQFLIDGIKGAFGL